MINAGIFAHVDAGKTTTVEQMLFQSGAIRRAGTVEAGNTQTDTLEVERQRGISVKSNGVVLVDNGKVLNLIDTPGHMDFTAEVERALQAVDCAVLILSAAEGIQAQTELFWKGLKRLGLPVLFFINKVDRPGCVPVKVLEEIRARMSPAVIPLNLPVSSGSTACSLRKAKFSEDDLLALCDDPLIEEKLLENPDSITQEEAEEALSRLSRRGKAYPCVFGSAAQGIGIKELLEAMARYLPDKPETEDGPLAGIVYKVEHDRAMGKAAHIRLYSGVVRNRDQVELRRDGQSFTEKVSQIRRLSGGKQTDAGKMGGNAIGVLYGLSQVRAGDILGEPAGRARASLAAPLFSVTVDSGQEDPGPLLKAIGELADEDPLLDYVWSQDERELYLKVMGVIQLEVLAQQLKARYGLSVAFSPATVIYKETPIKKGIGFESYTMPKPCWAVIQLLIEPQPLGCGFSFHSVVSDDDIAIKYQNHIRESMSEALKQGPLGWQVTDLKITLTGGEHHRMHTHPMDFFLATPMAVMNGLMDCGTTLLEPVRQVRITAAEELSSRIIGDILAMRGLFDSPVIKDGGMTIEALLPVADSMDYAVRLASITGGKGRFTGEFAGYRPCSLEFGKTAKHRGVDPRDRAKWILYKRGALYREG